jgi:hypothetical protein
MRYRIGKKQKRAILTKDGLEVVLFNKGQEQLAELVCELLNKHESKPVSYVCICDSEFGENENCPSCYTIEFLKF